MRAPIFFYVARRGTRLLAVPVHLVNDAGDWPIVRALAGRDAGGTITVVRSDLYRSVPPNARLVPGSRGAIARYGRRRLDEEAAARRLRKRISERRSMIPDGFRYELTQAQFERAFDETMKLAARVRSKTPRDVAWRFFDKDLDDWDLDEQYHYGGTRIFQMIDMILGAASRYEPPSINQHSPEYARAAAAESQANALLRAIVDHGEPVRPPIEAPARWLEVADALEVAEDAWRETGDEDQADKVRTRRQNILSMIAQAYVPRRR